MRVVRILIAIGLIIQEPALQYVLIVASIGLLVLPGRFGGGQADQAMGKQVSETKGGL